jgi:septum site-determining protein MinC
MRLKGRSFMAFILAPESPISDWLGGLDEHLARSASFFRSRPVVLDLAALAADEPGLESLLESLTGRGVRVIDVEGGALPGFEHASLSGGRDSGDIPIADEAAPVSVAEPPPATREAASLIVDAPVRSGQSVSFPSGDVTVIGSIASGAEVLAGGSIHVYGALRGRAIAGALGRTDARIFCDRMEAELVSIDGLYRTADMIDAGLRGRRVQVRMDGDSLVVSALR